MVKHSLPMPSSSGNDPNVFVYELQEVNMDFRGNTRAQAIQIGAVLLFGILVISFSIYQAFVIPGQNERVEFNHFVSVQDDMVQLRNAVIRASNTARSVPISVRLGTSYPARLVAAQPVGASGALQTASVGTMSQIAISGAGVSMSDVCGLDSPTSGTVVYQPGYEYFRSVTNVTYENTVTYTTGQQGDRSFQTAQHLVDGETIRVYPLTGTSQKTGVRVETVTLHGGKTGERTGVPGRFTLTLPTRLTATQWEEVLLDDEPHVTDVRSVAGEHAVKIIFAEGQEYDIRCTPVSTEGAPDNEPTEQPSNDSTINPNSGDDLVLRGTEESGNDNAEIDPNQLQLAFENTDDTEYRNITRLRFPFYSPERSSNPGNGADTFAIPESFEYGGLTGTQDDITPSINNPVVRRGGPFVAVGPTSFPPGTQRSVRLDFYCGSDGSDSTDYDLATGDFFVVTAVFEGGDRRTYFVELANSGSPNARCENGNNEGDSPAGDNGNGNGPPAGDNGNGNGPPE